MTAHVLSFPTDDAIFARLTERQRLANNAAERAEIIKQAKRTIDRPGHITDPDLREICAAFMAMHPTPDELADNWGLYYLRADQHIYAINRREWQARNCPRPETSADVARRFAHRWPEIVSWGAFVAVAMLSATGWLA